MVNSDYGERAPRRQARIVHPPAVVPGGLYTGPDLRINLNMSKARFKSLVDAGLKPIPDTGVRTQWFLGDDVLDFMRQLKAKGK